MDGTIPSYSKTEPWQRLFEPKFAGGDDSGFEDHVGFPWMMAKPLGAARPAAPERKAIGRRISIADGLVHKFEAAASQRGSAA
jgi:hypothetical protein